MVVLSAIFTTARNDQATSLHPCQGEDPACQSCQPVTPGSAASPP
jgi:hypothetical protein